MTNKDIDKIVRRTLYLIDKDRSDNLLEHFNYAIGKKRLKGWVTKKHITTIASYISRKFRCKTSVYWTDYWGWASIHVQHIRHKYVKEAKALIKAKLQGKLKLRKV